MSLMYSASEHVSTRTHKCAWRLSSAFAHSWRPRARPSCCRAFLITCYTSGTAVGRHELVVSQPISGQCGRLDGEIDEPGARLLHSFYPSEAQQRPLAEQQCRLECHLQRRTSYQYFHRQHRQQQLVEQRLHRVFALTFLCTTSSTLSMSSSALVDAREKERKPFDVRVLFTFVGMFRSQTRW